MHLIELQGVVLGYERPLFPPIDLAVREGDRLAILGPNGAGKSTLLRTLIGVLPPLAGKIRLPLGRRPRIGYVPQSHGADPAFPLSTHGVVLMGRYPALGVGRRPRAEDHAAASRQLELVGLSAQERTPFRELSGGQRQRALVARALVGEPELLVLDEPTSEMDPAAEHGLLRLVEKLAADQKASVLFVTHQISVAAGFATTGVLVNRQSGMVEIGPTRELLTSETLSRLYGLPVELRREAGRTLVWMASDGERGGREPGA